MPIPHSRAYLSNCVAGFHLVFVVAIAIVAHHYIIIGTHKQQASAAIKLPPTVHPSPNANVNGAAVH